MRSSAFALISTPNILRFAPRFLEGALRRKRKVQSAQSQEGFRVVPLPGFLLEQSALVEEHLAVIRERELHPLEGARRRSLEIDPAHVKAAPVARALELVLGGKPVGRAAEVG